jgi:hypothetical protein
MSVRVVALTRTLFVAAWLAAGISAAAQGTGAARPAAAGSVATRTTVPRTAWGHPDLQGAWTSEPEFGVPFERAQEFGNRQFLTDKEYSDRLAQSQKQAASAFEEIDVFNVDVSNAGAVGSPTSPPPHWLERSTTSRRTSLVIDPPDGRIPPATHQAQERGRRQPRGSFGTAPLNGPADFTLYDRCITFGGVPGAMFPAVYNANTRIAQSPDFVAITYEMIHETRLIPLDGRPHLSARLRQYLGDARGRWEGDTLVVETTNFNGRVAYRNSGDKLRVVERFHARERKGASV